MSTASPSTEVRTVPHWETVKLRLPPDEWSALLTLADRELRSVSDQARSAIRAVLIERGLLEAS